MMIRKPVAMKLSGNRVDVAETIEELKLRFNVVVNSRYIPNQATDGVHCFVTVFPKVEGIQQISEVQSR
jgi:hypothetical protein